MKNHIKKLIKKIKSFMGEKNQNQEVKDVFNETMATTFNVVLNSVASSVRKISLEELSIENRIQIASKIIADIDDLIAPIHTAIYEKDDRGEAHFDGTRLAVEMGAIPKGLEMFVERITDKDGNRCISVKIGKAVDLPKDMDEEIMKDLQLQSNTIGKA